MASVIAAQNKDNQDTNKEGYDIAALKHALQQQPFKKNDGAVEDT